MKYIVLLMVLMPFMALRPLSAQSSYCSGSISGTIPYLNTTNSPATAEYGAVDYAIFKSYNAFCHSSTVSQPIIILESFDFFNDNSPSALYGRLNSALGNGGLQDLRYFGYDIVTVSYQSGNDFIQKNAFAVIALINLLNASNTTNNENIIIGYGLGGIIARYALAYMEEHGIPHKTKLYISLDSPHQGFYIPLSVQRFMQYMHGDPFFYMFAGENIQTLFEYLDLLNSPMSRQLLKYRLDEDNPPLLFNSPLVVNSEYENFISELKSINNCNGYPSISRNVAISLGSTDGTLQEGVALPSSDMYAGYPALIVNPSSCSSPLYWNYYLQTLKSSQLGSSFPGGVAIGAEYFTQSIYGWSQSDFDPYTAPPIEVAPGSTASYYSDLKTALDGYSGVICQDLWFDNPAFIPTISALDFDTDDYLYNIDADPDKLDKTPFDAIYGLNSANIRHFTSPASGSATALADVAAFLADQILTFHDRSCAYQDANMVMRNVNVGTTNIVDEVEVINSSITVYGTATYTASSEINLLPGFSVEQGGDFEGIIQPCDQPKVCIWQPSNKQRVIPGPASAGMTQPSERISPFSPTFFAHPNPFSETLALTFGPETGTLTVFDILGREIATQAVAADQQSLDLNTAEWQPGVYIAVYETLNGRQAVRVVKQ